MPKSLPVDFEDLNSLGHSYYCHCLEVALDAITHARALVKGDRIDDDHGLSAIERLLQEALEAS